MGKSKRGGSAIRTIEDKVRELYVKKYCGVPEIAKKTGLSKTSVRKILERLGVLRPKERKRYTAELLREIGKRLELKDGQTLSGVVREMKKEGYCISTQGIINLIGKLSLFEFLHLLPVRRAGVASAEDVERFVVFSPEALSPETLFITDGNGKRAVLKSEGESVYVNVGKLVNVANHIKTRNIVIIANKEYARSKRLHGLMSFLKTAGINSSAVFPSSTVVPAVKVNLAFPLIRGVGREKFCRALADLPQGGRSIVMVIDGRGKRPFFFVRIDKRNRATDILKLYICPQSDHRWSDIANHVSFVASKGLFIEHLPFKISTRMKP